MALKRRMTERTKLRRTPERKRIVRVALSSSWTWIGQT